MDVGPSVVEEDNDELYLPRTAMNKLIKEIVPHLRVSVDSRDLLLKCSTLFIHLVAQRATEISDRNQRKTIQPEHVTNALQELGFGEYLDDMKEVLDDYKKQSAKKKKGSSRLDKLGIPEEELLRQQQELFAQARQGMESEQASYQQILIQQLRSQNDASALLSSSTDIHNPDPQATASEQADLFAPEIDDDYDED